MRELFFNPYVKGQYEYFPARKKQYRRLMLLSAAAVALLVGTGYLIWHTRKNLLMIPGLLAVLPLANFLSSYLAMTLGSAILTEEKRLQLKSWEDAGLVLYHLMYCDEAGKRQFLDATVVYQGAIVSYAHEVKDGRKVAIETDCILRLKKKALPLRLKIYTDWDEFLARVAEIEAGVPQEDIKKVERAEEQLTLMCL